MKSILKAMTFVPVILASLPLTTFADDFVAADLMKFAGTYELVGSCASKRVRAIEAEERRVENVDGAPGPGLKKSRSSAEKSIALIHPKLRHAISTGQIVRIHPRIAGDGVYGLEVYGNGLNVDFKTAGGYNHAAGSVPGTILGARQADRSFDRREMKIKNLIQASAAFPPQIIRSNTFLQVKNENELTIRAMLEGVSIVSEDECTLRKIESHRFDQVAENATQYTAENSRELMTEIYKSSDQNSEEGKLLRAEIQKEIKKLNAKFPPKVESNSSSQGTL